MTKEKGQPNEFQRRLGEAVRACRFQAGLSQKELAERCNLHRSYVSSIERGLNLVSLKTLRMLADALGVAPHTLVRKAEGDGEDILPIE